MAKKEIARCEQFLLVSQYFQRLSAADASKCVYRWERVNTSRCIEHLHARGDKFSRCDKFTLFPCE